MSQICYSILEVLSRKDTHIRGIATALSTNQMTVARKVHELEGDNVVDSRQEGRNKVYSIKNTLEATERLKMLEHQKLIDVVSNNAVLRTITQQIRETPDVKIAILFGSYAKGTQTKNSDIDIYIETKDKKLKKKVELLNSKISVKIGDFDTQNLLAKEIIKNHIILKGVDRYNELIHKEAS